MANGDGADRTQASRWTYVTTNIIKLAGAVVFVREAFTTKEALVMAICGLMIATVQGVEEIAILFVERLFGPPPSVRR